MEKFKTCYDYDPETLEYSGEIQTYIDPLETEKAGAPIYLTPAHATHTPPPDPIPEGKKAVYNPAADDWDLVDKNPPPPEPDPEEEGEPGADPEGEPEEDNPEGDG